jgi:hypothetical protein
MQIPAHIHPHDTTQDAAIARLKLHAQAAHLTRGKGFRMNPKKTTRLERLGVAAFPTETTGPQQLPG